MLVLGIDPGQKGAIVCTDGAQFRYWPMPLTPEKDVDFKKVQRILRLNPHPVYLERAVPFAMGSKGAFNYGRSFAALEIAIQLSGNPHAYVEPAKWTKAMHAGIDSNLKPKAKSALAVKRQFPKLVGALPRDKKGDFLDGPMDAFLIAVFGLRFMPLSLQEPDF